MPLGIRPIVDFVFRLLFSELRNADLLIDLLNAILAQKNSIVEVEILNPFSLKRFAKGKVSIVDVKARDSRGNWYVIEIQTTLPQGLLNRLVFYMCDLYRSQMTEGDSYGTLRPAICICLVTEPLFANEKNKQWEFRLHDVVHRRSLGDQLQLHLLELSKYHLDERSIAKASRLEQWVYFFNEAQNIDEARLRRLFPDPIFQKAIGVLAMVSRKPPYRMMYDDQQKAKLDQLSALKDERNAGREEGEARGEAKGKLIGRICTLQQVLGITQTDDESLSELPLAELTKLSSELQRKIAARK